MTKQSLNHKLNITENAGPEAIVIADIYISVSVYVGRLKQGVTEQKLLETISEHVPLSTNHGHTSLITKYLGILVHCHALWIIILANILFDDILDFLNSQILISASNSQCQ